MNATAPFVLVSDGHLLFPADEVTGLLRHIAADWREAVGTPDSGLDPETTLVLAGTLAQLADKVDAECIGLMPAGDEQAGRSDEPGSPRG
ncbi:DUF6213 family protein [Streptomyces sp. NBC_01216]|uniref:DUF6213 family protein n=1 Tax=unclassified Streptomyces TaxID=2593676 RepID=UPI002E13243C|nr:DUF6213 family protein [Streptomyces sp. NBC_01216]